VSVYKVEILFNSVRFNSFYNNAVLGFLHRLDLRAGRLPLRARKWGGKRSYGRDGKVCSVQCGVKTTNPPPHDLINVQVCYRPERLPRENLQSKLSIPPRCGNLNPINCPTF
jgi:hypothetical protein